ncbi:MAG: hypothetical protein QF442_01535 [Candidatus Peribacteraceae bacterium]|jgi:hypothetical protein|nr:hypothetical protein [Candidatus Peribacteraceae bacterium]
MRVIVALLIAVGLNTSLCTGGILSVSTNLAQQLSYSSEQTGPMSYGSIGILSCKRSERNSTEVGSVDDGHCEDADTCLSQSHSRIREKIAFTLNTTEILPSILSEISFESWGDVASLLRPPRTEPLFHDAVFLAHSLIKLE